MLLVTRRRPAHEALLAALSGATGGAGAEVAGDFGNPDDYLNVSGPQLWIEIEAPGHVEAADLADAYPGLTLPEPDDEQCLWLSTASVPAGAPPGSADVARRVFSELADRYDGVAIEH